MTALPYLPLWISDFDSKTMHLTAAEEGFYLRLLRLAWKTPGCSLPCDDGWLRRHVRATEDEYAAVVKPVLAEFFKVDRGRYLNNRLTEEMEKAAATSQRRSAAGRKGARTKHSRTSTEKGEPVDIGTPPRNPLKTNETRAGPAKARLKPGSGKSESESESGLLDLEIDSCLAGDLTALGELPPLDPDSPLLANVVAVGVSLAGIADPAQLHAEFVAAAGPRLQAGPVLRGSIGFLARALAAGCDPDRDMLPIVIERTFGRGGPIPTWRYFLDAWLERREERLRTMAAAEAAIALEGHAMTGKPVENPGDADADPLRASA